MLKNMKKANITKYSSKKNLIPEEMHFFLKKIRPNIRNYLHLPKALIKIFFDIIL